MACNSCKKQKDNEKIFKKIQKKVTNKNKPIYKKILDVFVRVILFFVLLTLLTPLFVIGYLVVLFKMVILSEGPNILPVIYFIATKILKLHKDEGDDDDDEDDDDNDEFDEELFNEDEYELENSEDIIVLK
jgi:hypothetical protein